MELNLNQWYKILAPRPVVIISTVNLKGNSNAAPFSFIMPVSSIPPLIAFASNPAHDTVKNIKETGDFVVNIPGSEILKDLWICAEKFDYGVSEIEKAQLTEERSSKVKSPRIKECFGHFECKLKEIHETGDHLLISGEVLKADIRDEIFSEGKYLIKKADPLMHISGDEFGLLGKIVKPHQEL